MQTDQEEIRFGMVAVNKGFATPEQVVDALEVQVKEDFSRGGHRRIGEILIDLKVITRGQLEEVLTTLGKSVQG